MPDDSAGTLYQVHTRILLGELGRALGRHATLDDLTDGWLDGLAARGFDWVWFLGVWRTGPEGRAISRAWGRDGERFRVELPDCDPADICGSPFAVQAYELHPDFGHPEALARLRARLAARRLRLMLDFVPNHVGPDHPWVEAHPEFFIHGSLADLDREPERYRLVESAAGPRILAFGRDPNYPGWPDTLQLNYRHAGLKAAMREELRRIAGRCDGVRCDMAMLLLPEVIERTWGEHARPADGSGPDDTPFWPAAIAGVRALFPEFRLLAEVYWDLEWTLLEQGFDWCYDKRLYDRLRAGAAGPVRDHLRADGSYQRRLARFLENHDEPRAAAVFDPAMHRAAAVITALVPGLHFFQEGQLDGRRIRSNIHLSRRPPEGVDAEMAGCYDGLLALLRDPLLRHGRWRLLEPREAWPGNPTAGQFVAFQWSAAGTSPATADRSVLVAVNFAPTRGQCRLPVPGAARSVGPVRFRDRLGGPSWSGDGTALADPGLLLDLPGWGVQALEPEPAGPPAPE